MTNLPILYSFRRCPYAIRARMAIRYAGVKVELREVVLANKPQSMLDASAKGTVPVLILPDKTVIDESLDIICWALGKGDPDKWQVSQDNQLAWEMVEQNDGPFKQDLDHYKYADRYPQHSMQTYRERGEEFLTRLEQQLTQHKYLLGDRLTQIDIAIFPFIRQFAFVDKDWFERSQYQNLYNWLQKLLASRLFISVMKKYPAWNADAEKEIF